MGSTCSDGCSTMVAVPLTAAKEKELPRGLPEGGFSGGTQEVPGVGRGDMASEIRAGRH